MNQENGGLLGMLGITGLLNTQFAQGYGQGLANAKIAGRSPDATETDNPTIPSKGTAGQPGTTPAVTPSAFQQILPYALAAASLLGIALLVKVLFRK